MDVSDKLEAAVLDHIRRYRLGVTRFCWSALRSQFPQLTKPHTKAVLQHLHKQQGLLQHESLFGNRSCYTLTDRYWQSQVDAAGERAPRTKLSERAAATAWAMLLLCCDDKLRPRKKLLEGELAAYLPGIDLEQGTSDNYYLSEGRLGYLRVDLGGQGRWDRIAAYCGRDLARHERQPALQQLIQDGYFEMTVATSTPQKARRLRQLMARRPVHEAVAVDIVALSDLLNLVSPPPVAITSTPR